MNLLTLRTLGVAGLAEKLNVYLERGLSGEDYADRQNILGTNYRPPPKRTSFCTLFFGALEDFMLRLLLVCAVISIAFDVGFDTEGNRKTGNFLSFDSLI